VVEVVVVVVAAAAAAVAMVVLICVCESSDFHETWYQNYATQGYAWILLLYNK
jgi:hypothetical protein